MSTKEELDALIKLRVPGKTEQEYLLRCNRAGEMAGTETARWNSRYEKALRLLGLSIHEIDDKYAYVHTFGYEITAPPPIKDGFKSWGRTDRIFWIKNEPEIHRIVCSANRNKEGWVIAGIRHWDLIMNSTLAMMTPENQESFRSIRDSGFIDNYGIFRNRYEAFQIAEAAGQLREDPRRCSPSQILGKKLYSEMVW